MIRNILHTLTVLLAVWLLAACSNAAKVVYLQDLETQVPNGIQDVQLLTFQPGDRMSITVHSRDHELADIFNLYHRGPGYGGSNGSYGGGGFLPYTVDTKGNIDVPVLGQVHVQGMTREGLAEMIKKELIDKELILDPTVIVEYADLAFYVLGEVRSPGRIQIPKDQISLMEAITLAGDIQLTGRRDNVLVLRTENGEQVPYRVDLTKKDDLYRSPVYYLQQNDMIIVEPTDVRAGQADLNANTFRNLSFWMSAPSYIMMLISLFRK